MTTPTENSASASNSAPASADQKWKLLGFLAFLILILFFFAAFYREAPNTGFAGAAAVLSMITAVAVGIERIIEGFWTIIGLTKGAFWPLNLINEQVNGMVEDLDDKLKPVYEEAEKAIRAAAAANEEGKEKLAEALAELEKLKANTTSLKALAPDNQRVNLIAASAFQNISLLEKKYPRVKQTAEIAHQAVIGVSDFVATFKDNPGRRLISILLGMILGLLVAGFIRLDVFLAAAGASEGVSGSSLLGYPVYWGVAFTGLLMGLGSNPTHEVIRAIQEYKKSRKSDNDPAPVIPPPGAPLALARMAALRVEGGSAAESAVAAQAAPRGVSTFSLRRRF